MNFDNLTDIANDGFHGFMTVEALRQSACHDVPNEPGVYLVLWPRPNDLGSYRRTLAGASRAGIRPSLQTSWQADGWMERESSISAKPEAPQAMLHFGEG
jgi:hypothetical protein